MKNENKQLPPQEWIDAAKKAADKTYASLNERDAELIQAVREGLNGMNTRLTPAPAIEITEAQSESLHNALIDSFDSFAPPTPAPADDLVARHMAVANLQLVLAESGQITLSLETVTRIQSDAEKISGLTASVKILNKQSEDLANELSKAGMKGAELTQALAEADSKNEALLAEWNKAEAQVKALREVLTEVLPFTEAERLAESSRVRTGAVRDPINKAVTRARQALAAQETKE